MKKLVAMKLLETDFSLKWNYLLKCKLMEFFKISSLIFHRGLGSFLSTG